MSYAMRDAAVRTLRLINGQQEIGRSRIWDRTLAFVICLIALPKFVSGYALLNYSYILSTVFLALGLCLIWGFAGIQSWPIGVPRSRGICVRHHGHQSVPGRHDLHSIVGLVIPTLFAAMLGYVMFYARVKGVYVAIMMLVVTLLFETFLDQTAGSQWHIGIAALGGNNGLGRFSGDIHEPPSLTLGFGSRVIEFSGQSLSAILPRGGTADCELLGTARPRKLPLWTGARGHS